MGPLVLLYHRVAHAEFDPFGLCLAPQAFRRQMQTIASNCHPLSLHAFVAAAREGRLAPNSIAVTFDDGYLDNLTTAQPILEEFDIPASFFITTATMESGEPYWWDELVWIVFTATRYPSTLTLTSDTQVEVPRKPSDLLRALHTPLMRTTPEERARLLSGLADELGAPERKNQPRPMGVDDVRHLAGRSGVTIGAHGVSHTALSTLSAREQMAELAESRSVLENVLARPVTSIAYPFGDASDVTIAAAHDVGFLIGMLVGNRTCDVPLDCLRVPRLEVNPTLDFQACLAMYRAIESPE